MNRKGFSLVELVVIIAIIGTLLSIVALNFHYYQVKYNTEKLVREMEADFENLRLTAIHQKQDQGAAIQANGFIFKSYSSADEPDAAGRQVSTKTLPYQISTDGGGIIRFDTRGFANISSQRVWVITPGTNAGCDTLIVSRAKTNIGKRQNDGTFTFK
jgi:prepilin-type N-terminal cleavage/methylation domain-containing protein